MVSAFTSNAPETSHSAPGQKRTSSRLLGRSAVVKVPDAIGDASASDSGRLQTMTAIAAIDMGAQHCGAADALSLGTRGRQRVTVIGVAGQ
jgi:hypothetical protein